MNNEKDMKKAVNEVTKQMVDDKMIIEAGWIGFKRLTYPQVLVLPEPQNEQLRTAFFAGAQHLYSSIMTILYPGEEATDNDLNRMEKIADELELFTKKFEFKLMTPQGQG